jgi:O-antigen/teichoic acid export membrane protein
MAKSISKNALFNMILNLCNIVLPTMVIPVVTNSLGVTLYYYITKAETYNTLLLALASFGVYQYGLREISKVRDDEIKLRKTFTSLFLITTISTLTVSAIYMFCLYEFYRNNPAYYTCVIVGLNMTFNLFYVEWVNEALENYDFITVKTMIVKIIYSIIVICLIRSQKDFLFFLYLGLATNILNNILSYFYIKRKIKFDFSNLKFVEYIKPMFIAVILSNTGLLYTYLDRLIINGYSSSADLAAFGITQKVISIINALMLTIIQVTMPRLSNNLGNNSKDNYLFLLNKVVKIYFLVLFPASIGLLCVSKQIMWIFERKYSTYVSWFPLLMGFSVYMLTLGIQGIISNQIIYLNRKEKEDVKIFFIGGLFNLIINGLLIITNTFTATNSIIITVISNIIVIILEYRVVRQQIKIDIRIFSFENIRYLYYSLLFIPIAFMINHFVNNIIISCTLDVTVCVLLYLTILLMTKDTVFFEVYNRAIAKFRALF